VKIDVKQDDAVGEHKALQRCAVSIWPRRLLLCAPEGLSKRLEHARHPTGRRGHQNALHQQADGLVHLEFLKRNDSLNEEIRNFGAKKRRRKKRESDKETRKINYLWER
jgi:hypothetical protein